MRYIDELVAIYNEEFVFNKAEVARMVKNGSFELLNFDEAKTLYAFSNRHAQVCEMFNEGLSRWSEAELMTLTKGYAVSKVREYAKSVTKVVETSSVSNGALEAEIAQLKEALTAKGAENAELQSEKRNALRRAKSAEQHSQKLQGQIETQKNEINILKTSLRQALCNNVVTKHAASIAGKVAKAATTKVVINIGR